MMNAMSPSPAHDLLAQAAGYRTPADADRMQAMVQALLQGRRPIALSGADTETLEHYSRLLVRDLRQRENVRIVPYIPGSTEKLVQQVNDLVTDVTLDCVIDRANSVERPIHVFVVHDSAQLTAAEFSLLVRLVNDLPGANLRIVLIQDRDFAITGNLAALGPQALHWRIGGGAPEATGTQPRRESSKQALREAMLESPEAMPQWAKPEAKTRRRWRLAFWRRHPQEGVAVARTAGKGTVKAAAGKPAAPSLAKEKAKPATASTGKPGAAGKAGARKAAPASKAAAKAPASPQNAKARRNRVVLVCGLFLSAALAGALGTWLQMHQPAGRAAAKPSPTPPAATSTASLAITLPGQLR